MHGVSEQDEIAYWRERSKMLENSIANLKAETRKDVARIAELNEQFSAIEAALNAANVPTRTEADGLPVTLNTYGRVQVLIEQRDEARMLARDARIQAEDRGTSFQAAIAKLAKHERVVARARESRSFLMDMTRKFGKPDVWLADASKTKRVEMTVRQHNRISRLLEAIDALDAEDGQ